jgi:hypothetical protein
MQYNLHVSSTVVVCSRTIALENGVDLEQLNKSVES